jgi:co-chaperonin GroES (HSP10)
MIELTDIKNYKPAGHKIVVEFHPTTTKSGLILPETTKQKRPGWFGTVISISPGADLIDAGVPGLKAGDVIDTDCVMLACRSFEIGQKVFILINDGDICGVVEK